MPLWTLTCRVSWPLLTRELHNPCSQHSSPTHWSYDIPLAHSFYLSNLSFGWHDLVYWFMSFVFLSRRFSSSHPPIRCRIIIFSSAQRRRTPHTVKKKATLAPLVRIQENVPQFKIPPLEPGREYHFQVYAVNAKGRSDPPYIIERVRVGSLLSPYGKCTFDEPLMYPLA